MLINVVSLFDGAGICALSLSMAGESIGAYISSEVDPHAVKVSKLSAAPLCAQYIQAGDVKNLTYKDGKLLSGVWDGEQVAAPYRTLFEGKIHLLTAGSPCQGFSASGLMKGLQDPRSQLFWHFVRLRDEIKPVNYLLENVVIKKKADLEIINSVMGEPVLIDSKAFTAQQRKRFYWASWGIGQPRSSGPAISDILEEEADEGLWFPEGFIQNKLEKGDISFAKGFSEKDFQPAMPFAVRGRGERGNITQKAEFRGGTAANCLTTVEKDSLIFVGGFEDGRRLPSKGPAKSREFRDGYRIHSSRGKAPTAVAQSGGLSKGTAIILHNGRARRLSPVERERLQGWPDGWASGHVSRSQVNKLTGNGWNAPTVAHIFSCR